MAESTDKSPPGKHTGFSNNPPTLTDPRQEKPKQTPSDTEQKQTAAARTKARNINVPGKVVASEDPGVKPQSAPLTHLRSSKASQQVMFPSQVDRVGAPVRSKNRDLYLQGGDSSRADNRPESERQKDPLVIQEAPVREDKQTNWSMSSSDSNTGFHSGKVEPVKPFSASAVREFGGLTPDVSDVTVYNEIAQKTPQMLNRAKMSAHREPTPGSEAERQQSGVCSRPLFSELRQRQLDSGFDSPFYHQK